MADAAFARYLRGAVDFAGGRRRVLSPARAGARVNECRTQTVRKPSRS